MTAIDLDALRSTPLATEPFDHIVVPRFVRGDALPFVSKDFPAIHRPGSFSVRSLDYGPAFSAFLMELRGPALAEVVTEKFNIDLVRRPTMVTVRGRARLRDGRIHTDSNGKLITALIYLNDDGDVSGGSLRLLTRPDDLESYAVEVPPDSGTLLVFRCTEHAWHGHEPVKGVRRSIQLNWVRDKMYLRREETRHRLSALFKRASWRSTS